MILIFWKIRKSARIKGVFEIGLFLHIETISFSDYLLMLTAGKRIILSLVNGAITQSVLNLIARQYEFLINRIHNQL